MNNRFSTFPAGRVITLIARGRAGSGCARGPLTPPRPALLLFLLLLISACALAGAALGPSVAVVAQVGGDDSDNLNDDDLAYYSYNYAHAAFASSAHSTGLYPPSAMVNGDRKGVGWHQGTGGWNDGTPNQFPDYAEIHLDGEKVINRVDIFTLQDNYANPVEPTLSMPFTLYGIVDFNLSYFNSVAGQWVRLAEVRGNNRVWRQFYFEPVSTQKLLIEVLHAVSGSNPNNWSRIVEVEARGNSEMQLHLPSQPTPNPCGGPGAEPCHTTVNLLDAIQNKTLLTYRAGHPDEQFRSAWRNLLDWDFGKWERGGSKNKPVLAHALALWRSTNPSFRSEWDDPHDGFTNPDPVRWWIDYLRCQNGVVCNVSDESTLQYMKTGELLSNTYDADTTRAVVAVYHWTVSESVNGRRTPSVNDLALESLAYLRATWGLYALGAGPGPADYKKNRGNRDEPLVNQRCHYNGHGYTYDGPFLALSGMRSSWAHLCLEDRGPMFTRGLLPEWNTMARGVAANAPVNLSWESNGQRNLLQEIERQQTMWKAQFPTTYPASGLNAYGLDVGQRQLIVNHILTGNSGQFFRDFLDKIRLRVPYHFLGWVDTMNQQVRLTVMETNTNMNTIPIYAFIYRHANRTAEALMPWEDEPKATLLPDCFKSDECRNRQDTGSACYYTAKERSACWTRPARDDVTHGRAFLANSSNQPAPEGTTPVKVWGSNLAQGEDPDPPGRFDVHGTIVETINNLNIPSASSGRRRYHITFYPDKAPKRVW